MKMLQNGDADVAGSGGREGGTVLVGVKLDSLSRELLTWALVKVAQPGDCVIALHVLGNEIVDRDGKFSLLSLVKAFDSVLAVYEGFCNLKQVDLKLKICRGSSIRKILVREAKSYSATKIIVGAAKSHHTIRSSTSVAKYLAKKLANECGVLAVNNGKIIFQKAGGSSTDKDSEEIEHHRRNSFLGVIQRSMTLSKSAKVLNESDASVAPKGEKDQVSNCNLEKALVKAGLNTVEAARKHNCSICGPKVLLLENSSSHFAEDSCCGYREEENCMAIVAVQKEESPSSPMSYLMKKSPEMRPGWPLLRSAQGVPERSFVRQISVVQWAMRLPSRHITSSPHKENVSSPGEFTLDGESGAIVAVAIDNSVDQPSPDDISRALPKELEGFHEKYSSTCRLFKYQELLSATSNFLAENLIGKGGSSRVFRGCLPDGKELAVKILKPSEDVLKEFVLEIEIITTLNHKNIISLLGFCFEDDHLLLVYDLLSRGSLEENLHGTKKDPHAFGWHERYKVALGVAEALDYLHNHTEKPVIHRDVKSSNVLLSDDFEPQLSDFGLAKWTSTPSSAITCTDVAGTFGYLAPEYFMYGKVTDKIDVYAFGVVLLELLSGRKPISNDCPKGQESIVLWAKPILNNGKISQLLDPNLGDNYDSDQIERIALAASLCIRRAPRARPQMSIVLKLLRGDTDVTKWAKLQLNAIEEFEVLDDEGCPRSNIQSHLNVALHDVEDDSLSLSSIEQSISLEDYLNGRWSRSSSFD